MQSITIGGNQAGQRLDKFLRKLLPEAGTGFLYKMLRKKNITLNGRKAEGSELLAQGDQVCFFFSDETFHKFSGKEIKNGKTKAAGFHKAARLEDYRRAYRELKGIKVIYEDDHVLILDKPAGILAQKAEGDDLSLNEWMIGYLLDREPGFAAELESFHPSVCNRLDRNTSGLVLCGKSLPGLQFLSRCIRERSIRKFYRAICVGRLQEPALVKGYLKKDADRNRVRIVPVEIGGVSAEVGSISVEAGESGLPEKGSLVVDTGEYIETAYKPVCVGEGYTLLEVELITGKPHQIRAHLAEQGHPLIGDFKYGNAKVNKSLQETYGLEHQLLHAFRVEFPDTEENAGLKLSGRIITVPCPEQFEQIQKTLELM